MPDKTKILIALLFLFISNYAYTSSGIPDSLLRKVNSVPTDTGKVQACLKLCREYIYSDTGTAMFFVRKGLDLANRINYKTGIADCLR